MLVLIHHCEKSPANAPLLSFWFHQNYRWQLIWKIEMKLYIFVAMLILDLGSSSQQQSLITKSTCILELDIISLDFHQQITMSFLFQ